MCSRSENKFSGNYQIDIHRMFFAGGRKSVLEYNLTLREKTRQTKDLQTQVPETIAQTIQ